MPDKRLSRQELDRLVERIMYRPSKYFVNAFHLSYYCPETRRFISLGPDAEAEWADSYDDAQKLLMILWQGYVMPTKYEIDALMRAD